ncbi:MAG: PKD domain-containing protein, partial [Thermoplasmata archaeon]|nr:PKD domain-containing protein [Thermoplasmata archaeon]
GNYWSDYTGEDTNDDDLGDTDENGDEDGNYGPGDYYPLIKITNQKPVADFDYLPENPRKDEEIQFEDKSYDLDGDVVEWYWDFGDEETSDEQNPKHKYSKSGDYEVKLTVTDNEGTEDSIEKTITVSKAPNKKPEVEITGPAEGQEVKAITTIKGKSSDEDGIDDIQKVEIKITNSTWDSGWLSAEKDGDDWSEWKYDWDATEVENDDYTIWARAFDGEDYSDVFEVDVRVKNEKENKIPTVTISKPEEGEEISGTYTIEGTASDEDGEIEEVEIKIDDKDWETAEGEESWDYDWDTTEVSDGEHTIYARAFDGKDYSEVFEVNITIKNEAQVNHDPEIEITAVENIDDYTVQITWIASDPDGNTLKIDLYYDTDTNPENGKTPIAKDLSNTGSYDWDVSGMEDGDYYILALAMDPRGAEGRGYSEKMTISLPVFAPDFKVLSIKALSSSFEPGNAVVINAVIRNLGSI